MARISGINIPTKKRIIVALTYLYGIGNSSAKKICERANLNESTRVSDLTDDVVNKLREIVDKVHCRFLIRSAAIGISNVSVQIYICVNGLIYLNINRI